MKTKTFILKFLRLISLILLLSTLLVLVVKNYNKDTLHQDRVSKNFNWRRHSLPNKCSSFLFYASFLATYILSQYSLINKWFYYGKSLNI